MTRATDSSMKPGLVPTHPGEILREDVLPAFGWPEKLSKTAICKELGVSRPTLDAILDEKRSMSAVMALKFGHWCGNGAGIWLRMQVRFDEYEATKKALKEGLLDKIPVRAA